MLSIVIVTLLTNLAALSALKMGDSCIMNDTNERGICTSVSKCSEKLFGPTDRLVYTKCDRNNIFVICCPERFLLFAKDPEVPKVESSPKSIPSRTDNRRISEQKCEEYQSANYVESVHAPLFNRGPDVVTTRKQQCRYQPESLIVGGKNAGLSEFPHMALLGYDEDGKIEWKCGGSLISDEYVLTAAHCCYKNLRYIRLGELDYSSNTDGAEPKDYNISKVNFHPEYASLNPLSTYHDIALIRLTEKVLLTPDVRPACLPTSFETGDQMIATGWGQTNFTGSNAPHLQKVVLKKFTRAECSEIYTSTYHFPNGLHESQFCFGDKVVSKDTCFGDSGGPIQNYHKQFACMYTLHGITSQGQACGTIEVPGLYVYTYSYIDWIERLVW